MFGSLRKKLEETAAQINPFDGGKTAATVRANRNQAPPAQTIRSQPNRNSLVGRNDNQPGFQITNNSFTRGLSRGFDQVNPLDNNRTWKQRTATNSNAIDTQIGNMANNKAYGAVSRGSTGVLAGVGRFGGAGSAQFAGGIYDAVTPGKGTNRLSDWGNTKARELDVIGNQEGNAPIYRGTQVGGEVVSALATGGIAKSATTAAGASKYAKPLATAVNAWDSKLPQVANVVEKGLTKVNMPTFGKLANYGVTHGLTSTDIAQDTAMNIKNFAHDVSKGNKITPQRVASDFVMTAVGNPVASGLGGAGGKVIKSIPSPNAVTNKITTNLAPTVSNAVNTAKNVTTRLVGAGKKIDQTLFTPRANRLDLETQDALKAYSDRLVGADPYITGKVESDLIKKVRAIGDANGVDLTNGTVVQQLDRIEALLNGYKGSSGALNSKPVPVDPLEALKQEARYYHGSTNDKLTSLQPGSKTGLNEKRNLIYLTDDPETAKPYTKNRGTDGSGQGVLTDSKTGKVYEVQVEGKTIGAYDFEELAKLKNVKGFNELSGKTKNSITNDTGLSAEVLEANPELRNFLIQNGYTNVKAHLPNGTGKSNEIIVLDPSKAKLSQPPQSTPVQKVEPKADHWTTPLPDDGKRPPITAKDTNGIIPQEGDVIEFPGLLGKKGRTTVHWQGPVRANASGKEIPGQWIGNGVLREDSPIPFTVVERNGKPLAPKVEVPTGFSKSLEDAGFSTPQSRVGRNKVQAGSQARTPNQLKSASMGQPLETVESPVSYRKEMPETAQSKTPKSGKSQQQSGLSSSRSSDNIIDLESIDVNDPFGNRSLIQKVKNEFNRMFIDEDAEMISLLRKVEKETGSKDMVEKWLQDTDMVRGSNSIANSKVRSNDNLKGAIHGLSKKEVKQLDEYASARSELYNLENGLSASKSKEKLQSIINKHEAKYGKRFESLNKYYNDLAKDLHEAGIISKQQMDSWAKNKDYVRVQRDMEDLLEPSVGKSRSRSFGSTSTSKKRTGSKRDILSPTETAFKRTQEIQLEIQRNKAASNIIDVLEKHGLSERIPQSQAHGKNVIKRFKDGKVEYFATNKDIKRVIENVRPFELGVIAKVVSFPTRVFKAGTTGLSAPFAVTNYARDQVGSAIYSKSVMATHNPKNIVSGIYQGVKDFGGVGNSDIWEKFVKHAGDQTSFDMTRGTLGSKSIMNEVRRGSLKQRGITLVDPRYLVRNVEDLISITEKSTRYQNFKGIYEKAIKEGLGEDVAIQKATQAALQNSVNFGRAGSVAKVANLILPYFNAGIQGSRNLGRSFRDRPVATAAKSVGFVGIPMVALTLHNYSDPETREIYSNIDETEKQDNFIIVLPGAKQRDDGTYEGILKIPKPQGYRELLDPLRSYAESFASGEDPKDVASMLKDMLPAISGPIQTEDTGKLISSLTPQALKPALQAHLNKDLYWGNDVVPDYMIAGTDDPTERARKNTSGMARFIANRLNVSPIAVEKFIIDSTGSLGRYGINAIDSELARRDIIPDEQIGGRSISSDFKRRTTEARGIENKNMTDGQRYFRDREEVAKSLNPQQKTAWESYNQSNKNFKGEVVFDKSSFAQKQAKASAYVQFPELFETDKKLDKKARDRGEPGNPLYDLNYKQAIKVVLKKALPPGSKDSELDALYNQPWYADFKAKESQYYDKIFAGKEKEDSGYPQRSPELQRKMDYYYTLPKGTGQRSDFLKSNPDVIQHWDAVEAWTNGERAKIGLDPTTKDDSFGFGSGGGRGGRRGRSKAGYDYTKALFDANVGSVSMTKDLQSILEKYMKANAKISKKA